MLFIFPVPDILIQRPLETSAASASYSDCEQAGAVCLMPVYMEHRHPQHDDICNLDRYVHLCQIADCVILKAEIPVHSPMVSFCAGPAVVYSLEFAGIPRYIARHSWILADLQQIYMVLVFIPNCFPISVVSAIVRFLHLSRIPGLRINLLFFNGSIIYKHLSCFTSVD